MLCERKSARNTSAFCCTFASGKREKYRTASVCYGSARDPSLRLVIAGEGPAREQLGEQARELASQCVRFLGVVAREHLPDFYASSDAF